MSKFLNLPILGELCQASRVLVLGVGGGFDAFAGIPLIKAIEEWSTLIPALQCKFIVANYSDRGKFLCEKTEDEYPHGLLSEKLGVNVWSIGRNGPQLLQQAIQKIVDDESIDTILMVDGGVDSLMRGDEVNPGTVLEDFCMLAAVDGILVEQKILACLGFGVEYEEEVNHYRVLENISGLAASNGLIGSCILTPQMDSFREYKRICESVWSTGRKSHIHTKVIDSVMGEFGNKIYPDVDARLSTGSRNGSFLSPLTAMYWFFEYHKVIEENLVIPYISGGKTFTDALMLYRQTLSNPKKRTVEKIPL